MLAIGRSNVDLDTSAITALESNASVDVCVVGAGISGLLIAERLASSGRTIVVLEQRAIRGGETRERRPI